jgi:hypothetical protein
MKRYRLIYFLGFIIIVFGAVGCGINRSDEQLGRIENQLQALNSSISSIQQEMASLRRAVTDTQEQNRVFQQQVLETINSIKTAYVNQTPAVNTDYLASPGYASPYYMNYRRIPPYRYPPYPYPHFPPFH